MAKAKASKTQRGIDTRQQILQTTYELTKKHNLFSVTLDQISEVVGVAKTSILWHFGSKDALFLELGEFVIQKYEEKAIEQFSGTMKSSRKIELFLDDYLKIIEDDHEIIELFFSLIFDKKIAGKSRASARRMYANWRRLGASYLPLPEKESHAVATTIIALVDGIYLQWLVDPENVDIKAVFNTVLTLLKSSGN